MKSLLTLLFILVLFFTAAAQHQHFVYLQTDNKQAFFVRINEQVYSSSTSGYAVIPKLTKGDYNLSIGFPKNEWPQQTISIKVNGDAGYLLKNFQEKGWGLYNIQTMELQMAGTLKQGSAGVAQTKTDAFSNVLADVVNTPSLKEEVVKPKEPEVKPVANIPPPAIKEEQAPNPVSQVPISQTIKTNIARLSSRTDAEGIYSVYLDASTGDTIKVFMETREGEHAKLLPETTPKTEDAVKKDTPENNKPVVAQKTEEPKPVVAEDKRFLNIEMPAPGISKDSSGKPVEPATAQVKKEEKPVVSKAGLTINSDCKTIATDNDFMKARKKMAAEDNNDDMIDAARKLFKTRCYSTEQIKNLAVLFLNDEGKYRFFDAAYPFVHDTQNFVQLQSELKEEYYITRFRAMVRQ